MVEELYDLTRFLLAIHAVATLMMTGLIWFVQLVHYPMFQRIDPTAFPAWEADHASRTGRLVAPLMIIEMVSGCLLLWNPPFFVPDSMLWTGAILLLVIWGSTFVLQVPLHRRLGEHYEREAIARLVRTNWIRTIAWSLRGVLIGWILAAY